jgi:hypothetical protein
LYAEAKRYINAQNYRLALPLLQEAAAAGNADAKQADLRLQKHFQP